MSFHIQLPQTYTQPSQTLIHHRILPGGLL